MTAPAAALAMSLITEIRAAGGIIRRDGNRIKIAASGPLPPDLVTRYRAARPELLGALADPAEKTDWHLRHAEALTHWRALHPEAKAESLAWGGMQDRWHRLYGARAPEWQCAGCGELIGGYQALDLTENNRVHLDENHGIECLIAYGECWRNAATRALVAIGLKSPFANEPEHA
jgi:hypothetical protein